MLSTYSFYFVLGYYITNHCAKRENIRLVYALGFVGFTVTVLLNGYMAAKYNIFGKYYNNSTINVAFEAIFIFVLFKNLRLNYNRMNDFMIKLSKYSFGAYWVHVFILKSLHIIGIHSLAMNPLFAVPVVAILVIALSFSISYALNKIPYLNKWIV